MKIFITGGTGFIGGHLVNKLIKLGHQVYLLTRHKEKVKNLEKNSVSLIQGDIENLLFYKNFLDSIDMVIHLAAVSGMRWGMSEKEYYRLNVQATIDLLKASLGKIKCFIYCSSINAVSKNNFKNDPYGKSKWQAEQQVLEFYNKGLNTVILRPAIVYGPGDLAGVILRFIKLINQKKFYIIGSGDNHLSFVYIDDLVNGFIKALDCQIFGQTYELTGPDLLPLKQTVKIISDCLGITLSKLKIPVSLAYLAGWFSELIGKLINQEPLITRSKVEALTRDDDFSLSKAEKELNYHPQVNFKEGVFKTINWYKENI